MHLATVLLITATPQTTVTPSKTLFCEQKLGNGQNDFSGLARLETDQDHHKISSVLTISGPGYTTKYDVIVHGQRVAFNSAVLDVKEWPLPKSTAFPIKLAVKIDGVAAGEFNFDTASVAIYDMADLAPPLTYFPAVRLSSSFKPQRLWGYARIDLLTTDSRGKMIDRRVLKGPEWSAFSAFADDAFKALEEQRASRECRPHYTVMVVD